MQEVFDTAIIAGLDYQSQVKSISKPTASNLSTAINQAKMFSEKNSSKAKYGKCMERVKLTTDNDDGGGFGDGGGASDGGKQYYHHYVPTNRTRGANISDAKLVGWRKSLTKLSAQEALQNESMQYNTTGSSSSGSHQQVTTDDYEFYSTNNTLSSTSTSCNSKLISSPSVGVKNYRTIVKSKRTNKLVTVKTTSVPICSDQDDDQGFHDDDVEVEVEEDINLLSKDDRLISLVKKTNLNESTESSHKRPTVPLPPKRNPYTTSQGKSIQPPPPPHLPMIPNSSTYYQCGQNCQQSTSTIANSQTYFDPYTQSIIPSSYQYNTRPISPPVRPIYQQTRVHPPTTASRFQSFFQLNRQSTSTNGSTSTSSSSKLATATTKLFSPQTNLATTLRSSSFFFLPSNTLKKSKKLYKSSISSATSSITNTNNTPTNSEPFKQSKQITCGYQRKSSEIFQLMSNSVTELRNRKSLFRKFTSSLSSSSTRSSSTTSSSTTSMRQKSKLKSKKLKELYLYNYDSDDYEEIDNERRSKCLLSCCLPF